MMLIKPTLRALRAKEVAEKLSCSLSNVYDLAAKDSSFPKPVQLAARWSVWIEDEIDDWLLNKIAAYRETTVDSVIAALQKSNTETEPQKKFN